MASNRERTVTKYLKGWFDPRRPVHLDGFIVKIVGEGHNGIPDYLLAYNGALYLIEAKRPKGGKVSPIQDEVHKKYLRNGVVVRIISSQEEVIDFLYEICTT